VTNDPMEARGLGRRRDREQVLAGGIGRGGVDRELALAHHPMVVQADVFDALGANTLR
jgi:hypothetical protein